MLKAWCGAEGEAVAFHADAICSMCIEELRRRFPTWMADPDDENCPVDGRPCPDEIALLEMVARRLLPE